MSLIGTLTSGVSAMRSFTKGLEVIGNNISNVNTIGYKSSSASFADTFSNTLRSSAPSTGTTSNQSATQVGTGVKLQQISQRFTQGALSTTGVETDLAISGSGFFVVKNPVDGRVFATRAGNFRIDDNGYLVSSDGLRVQGLTGGTSSTPASTVGDIRLKTSAEIAAEWATNNATAIHNANVARDAASGASGALDSLVTSTGSAATASDVLTAIDTELTAANTDLTNAQTALAGDPNDQALIDAVTLAETKRDALQQAYTDAQAAQGTGTPAEQLAAVKASLQASAATATAATVAATTAATEAATPAERSSYSIDKFGNVVEFYANGSSVATNRVLLQNFNDPSALVKEGNNLFSGFTAAGPVSGSTALSGANNTAGTNGLGTIQSNTLELANVDLTEEFANMITVQRSFQASSRLVTVSDSILEEIANLKR